MEKSSYRLIETHGKRTIVYTNIYIVNKELVTIQIKSLHLPFLYLVTSTIGLQKQALLILV